MVFNSSASSASIAPIVPSNHFPLRLWSIGAVILSWTALLTVPSTVATASELADMDALSVPQEAIAIDLDPDADADADTNQRQDQAQSQDPDPAPLSLPMRDAPQLAPRVQPSLMETLDELKLGQTSDPISDNETEETQPALRITVTGSLLDQPVYAPFRREGTIRESSQPVYVINRDQIEAQGARTVDEALRFLPGVLSEGTTGGQLGALSGQFIRGGTSSQTLILLNGRPLNDGAGGSFDLSNFTTDAIEQIEVLPGGGSVLYGSNAIGGVINIITRQPLEEDGIQVSAGLDIGRFDFNRQDIQVRGRSGGSSVVVGYNRTASDNDFPFSLTSTDFEDTRANADVLYNNVNVQLAQEIGDRHRLQFGTLFLSKDLGVPGGVPVPGSLTGGFNNLTEDDNQYTENWLLDLTYEGQLDAEATSILTARVFADFLDATFDNPSRSTQDTIDQTSLGAQIQHNWQFAEAHNITYGVDYRNTQADNDTLSLITNETTENYNDSINQVGLFARYQVDLTSRWTTNVGVRQDFNDLVDGSFTSFNVGTRYAITDSTNLRANVARNFRVPTLGDRFFAPFNNPDLDTERALSFDIGVDQELGDRGLFRFTFYRNVINDAISFDLDTFTPQNIGKVEAIGIETELNVQLADDVFAFANYTWNQPELRQAPNESNEGNLLPFVHADSLNLGVAYESSSGLYAALLMHYISDFFVDRGNQESLDSRTIFDLNVRVPVTDFLAVTASLNNIFDTQFEEFPGFPGVGRSFQVGVRSEF